MCRLRVNLDMGKTVYAHQIMHDNEIPETVVRTSTLPEELGRIEYLLSDKTGTLTQNGVFLFLFVSLCCLSLVRAAVVGSSEEAKKLTLALLVLPRRNGAEEASSRYHVLRCRLDG